MNQSKSALLITLFAIQSKGKKHYVCPSVNTLIKLLKSYHNIAIKRRWLFGCMKHLIDAGLIKTSQRYKNNTEGEIYQLPSMITFTIRGLKHLISKRVAGAKQMLKQMLSWLHGGDKRFPQPRDISPWPSDENRAKNLVRLRALLDML